MQTLACFVLVVNKCWLTDWLIDSGPVKMNKFIICLIFDYLSFQSGLLAVLGGFQDGLRGSEENKSANIKEDILL